MTPSHIPYCTDLLVPVLAQGWTLRMRVAAGTGQHTASHIQYCTVYSISHVLFLTKVKEIDKIEILDFKPITVKPFAVLLECITSEEISITNKFI